MFRKCPLLPPQLLTGLDFVVRSGVTSSSEHAALLSVYFNLIQASLKVGTPVCYCCTHVGFPI